MVFPDGGGFPAYMMVRAALPMPESFCDLAQIFRAIRWAGHMASWTPPPLGGDTVSCVMIKEAP
ncbi:hypothetical protein BV911_14385 [Pseudoruegeria sp. SK021]|nr:hypothetical protein BV911_14385 [Pseudoruegeria sp. SK021]